MERNFSFHHLNVNILLIIDFVISLCRCVSDISSTTYDCDMFSRIYNDDPVESLLRQALQLQRYQYKRVCPGSGPIHVSSKMATGRRLIPYSSSGVTQRRGARGSCPRLVCVSDQGHSPSEGKEMKIPLWGPVKVSLQPATWYSPGAKGFRPFLKVLLNNMGVRGKQRSVGSLCNRKRC